MAKIQKLQPHVADLIAAGEVVERPASVIKELVENSIDAGATSVTVEIKNGGMSYMRVTDNGSGMGPQDAEMAFLRHATSKLRDERGLEAIGTLGFRGEALAAISAVSRVELLTREKGADEGCSVMVEGGTVIESAPAGCPEGTTMIVRNLFFNTPARLKFMKTDKAEGAACTAAVLHCALSNPGVSVRYIKDGKEELHTPGDGKLDSCVYSALGREFAKGLMETNGEDAGVSVKGFVSRPAMARGNRTNQFFFCNGRYIKSRTLQAAVEQAFANQLFTGRFPSCVLYINVSPASVDVNIHPAKTEIKFLNEKQVFDCVYYAVKSALEKEKSGVEIELSKSTAKAVSEKGSAEYHRPAVKAPTVQAAKSAPRENFFSSMGSDDFKKKYNAGALTSFEIEKPLPVREPSAVRYQTKLDLPVSEKKMPVSVPAIKKAETAAVIKEEHSEDWRIIGETQKTYVLVEKGDSLWLIDKHAAHERIIFDKLKSQNYEPMSQELIEPVYCDLGADDVAELVRSRQLAEKFGFEIDAFGETSVAVRRVPSDIEKGSVSAVLEEMVTAIKENALEEKYDHIRHTIACKAAIKAGKSTDMGELRGLVQKVLDGEVKYCPHGRPVAVELTKAELDKAFKRT